MEKLEFEANLAAVKERKILLLRVALSTLFVLLVTSMWIDKAHPHDGVRTVFKTVSLIGYPMVVFVCITAVQRMSRRLGLHCPHCDRSLSGPVGRKVLASDTCCHCGNRLF
jgi:hypothetical protein